MSAHAPHTANEPLSRDERRRGRRLAIASHPFGMTFRVAFQDHLPTLALVWLGASEGIVGLHGGLRHITVLLKLPTLRALNRVSKKTVLLAGHASALVASVPLIFFGAIAADDRAVVLVMVSLAAVAAALQVSNTVWFPLLRGYVEPTRIARFFGTLRTGWHLALIAFFVGSTVWLGSHEGAFGELFAVAWALGLVRIALIARLPERAEAGGERIRVRDAVQVVRSDPSLRRYLLGVTASASVKRAVLPFAIVMLRREIGFSSGDVIYTTVAVFTGGLVSLYVWGRIADGVGAEPVLRWTSIGMGASYLALLGLDAPDALNLAGAVAFFFVHSVLASGYGVAETRLLFELTPPEAPAQRLVVAEVIVDTVSAGGPLLAGIALGALLTASEAPLGIYHGFFMIAAVLQAASFLPLRAFAR